jgi:hypothetical protein
MATKDTSPATINSAVRIGRTTYTTGQEADLAGAATPEQIARLTEKGAISGNFTTGGKKSVSTTDASATEPAAGDTPTGDTAAPAGKSGKK